MPSFRAIRSSPQETSEGPYGISASLAGQRYPGTISDSDIGLGSHGFLPTSPPAAIGLEAQSAKIAATWGESGRRKPDSPGFPPPRLALLDPETASRVASQRQIHWPDATLWRDGVPRSFAAVFAGLAPGADEERVGALGLRWLRAGILPEALDVKLRPLFEILVDFRKDRRSVEPSEES